MIYWMSVCSEWYTECKSEESDKLNVSTEWMMYWMSVRNDILNISMKWVIYWRSVRNKFYAECQYEVNYTLYITVCQYRDNDILNVSIEWMIKGMSLWSEINTNINVEWTI
jgi:hypothetical protein